ncbi:MAG TPA: hypothetical protein VD866_08610 [Urbifossiella sp.]|nr:hypothetical protein [Urbifossiella sp.]
MARAVLVWGTWAALTLGGLGYVAWFGRNCPYMDEWSFLPIYDGKQELISWLWEPHFEHRYPVGRLVYIGLFRLTGDLRAGMVLSVLCLSGAAALLMAAAARIRGRCSLADVFFPLALLHPGHRENVLMSYQVCFTLPVLITAGLAYLTIRPPEAWTRRRAAAVGMLTALLPGFGLGGLVLAVGVAAPLAVLSLLLIRRGAGGPAGVLAAGLAVTVAGVAVVLATYPGTDPPGISRSVGALWGFTTRISAMGFGPAAEWLWAPAALAVWAVLGRGLVGLRRAGLAGDAAGAVAALAVPVGGGLLAAALVWGRGWSGADGALASRYAALMLPLTSAVFLVAIRFGGPSLRAWGPASLAVLAAVAWPINVAGGVEQASRVARQTDAIESDIVAGLPPHLIAERYDWQLWRVHPYMGLAFEWSARIGFHPFRGHDLTPSMGLRTTHVALPDGVRGVLFPPGTAARLTGAFAQPQHRFADIRVRVFTADGVELRDETFSVAKSGPSHLIVHLDGRPTRIEVTAGHADGEYRITAAEVIGRE